MRFSAICHSGLRRRTNEDSVEIDGWSSRSETGAQCPPALQGAWAVVADGMGGHAFGEIASELAVAFLAELLPDAPDADRLRAAIVALHLRLHELMAAQPELRGMGTTIAGIIERGSDIMAFWVGDSRIYRWRDNQLHLMSRDDAIDGMLTQCLGGSTIKPLPKAHVKIWSAEPGDRLLLCSDGLSSMVPDEKIAGHLGGSPKLTAESLVSAALDAGGHDNISIVIADC